MNKITATETKRLSLNLLFSLLIHGLILLVLVMRLASLMGSGLGNALPEFEVGLEDKKESGNGKEKFPGESDKKGNSKQPMQFDRSRWGELANRLEKSKGMRSKHPEIFDPRQNSGTPQSYISRHRDYEDIIVKDVFPTLNNIEVPLKEIITAADKSLQGYEERNEFIEKYRKSQKGELKTDELKVTLKKSSDRRTREPLHFPKNERESYFDETMGFSKENQLTAVIEQYGDYDPNKGDLPATMRDLFFDNLLRTIYNFSNDPNWFKTDYYQENLNKEDYLYRAFSELKSNRGTRYGTEILFTIENIYNTQQRAFDEYFQFKAMERGMSEEMKNRIHIRTLSGVRERYDKVLAEKNLNDPVKLKNSYFTKRMELAERILAETPGNYRKRDGLFLKGTILWEQGVINRDAELKRRAFSVWKSIASVRAPADDFFYYEKTYKDISGNLEKQTPEAAEPWINSSLQRKDFDLIVKKQAREKKLLYPDAPASLSKPPEQ